jgi:uncharacterized metal-binding protein YceD (DUF177 family)
MAAGLPDLVDCAQLADEAAALERVYELSDMPRLKELLAERTGSVRATFVFARLGSGRVGAEVAVEAVPLLLCQRCMQGFGATIAGSSEVEFADDDAAASAASEREFFRMDHGHVSLRDLAEEELLLALPHAFMCDTPRTCGKAPTYVAVADAAGDMRRPFGALQDLLKKT